MDDSPLPSMGDAEVAPPTPGEGIGCWAGGSSAALDVDGSFVIAHRVRTGAVGRGSVTLPRGLDAVP